MHCKADEKLHGCLASKTQGAALQVVNSKEASSHPYMDCLGQHGAPRLHPGLTASCPLGSRVLGRLNLILTLRFLPSA